jgi:hypothetical protein
MGNLANALCVTAIFALPIPVGAQGTTTGFDGTYVGVSHVMGDSQTGHSCRNPPPPPVPLALTIANGVAQTKARGGLDGSVNAQGMIVMHDKNGLRLDGQINAQGLATVQLSLPYCYWKLVWQRSK